MATFSTSFGSRLHVPVAVPSGERKAPSSLPCKSSVFYFFSNDKAQVIMNEVVVDGTTIPKVML